MHSVSKIANKKNQKRERIIEAASELFSKMNFHEVMMEDVARLASIAKGTLYNYFNSKEDLYFSIMVLRMEYLINSLREKTRGETAATHALHTFTIHHYMFMIKYSCFFVMFQKERLTAENEICELFRKRKHELKELLKEIVESGKKSGMFRNMDTGFMCDLILGSIYGAVDRAIENSYSKEIMETERESLFEFILKGVIASDKREPLPLQGMNIVMTRSTEDSADSALIFSQQGADVIPFPTIDITAPEDWSELKSALAENADYLIFTSANAVRMFLRGTAELGAEIYYKQLTVAAVGRKTAIVCTKNNIEVSLVPDDYSAKGLIKKFEGIDVAGKTVLIPSSAIGGEELSEYLKSRGARVNSPVVYDVGLPDPAVTAPAAEKLKEIKPDVFIFTSPSTFRNFLKIMNIDSPALFFNGSKVAAIGPTTKAEIENAGIKVSVFPEEYTMDGLLKRIIKMKAENQL